MTAAHLQEEDDEDDENNEGDLEVKAPLENVSDTEERDDGDMSALVIKKDEEHREIKSGVEWDCGQEQQAEVQ